MRVGRGLHAHRQWPAQLRQRAQDTLERLLPALPGTPVVVSHAACVGALALMDERLESVACPLCALFVMEYDGRRWQLTLNADVSHIGESCAAFRFP